MSRSERRMRRVYGYGKCFVYVYVCVYEYIITYAMKLPSYALSVWELSQICFDAYVHLMPFLCVCCLHVWLCNLNNFTGAPPLV